jgi:hypothetical protein
MHFDTASDLGPGFEGLVAEMRVTQYLAGPRFVARGDRLRVLALNRTGFIRGLIPREDGAHGTTQ